MVKKYRKNFMPGQSYRQNKKIPTMAIKSSNYDDKSLNNIPV